MWFGSAERGKKIEIPPMTVQCKIEAILSPPSCASFFGGRVTAPGVECRRHSTWGSKAYIADIQVKDVDGKVEKHLEHNFIDFVKVCDRMIVLASRPRSTSTTGWLKPSCSLCDKVTSTVLVKGRFGDFFRTTVGVRLGCPYFECLFNIFLEKIMQNTFDTSASIGEQLVMQ